MKRKILNLKRKKEVSYRQKKKTTTKAFSKINFKQNKQIKLFYAFSL